ncbi:hypothetical protein E3N88_00809 [Mikania micrantha]|uniref:Uncharacterized protein n=1 Tax=Mikania micrantha TaxID=192012 RepID=A0A5N6PZX2_9ASTR|nr:hypothetical protein E3N88_00809 [Mikania micrantha]
MAKQQEIVYSTLFGSKEIKKNGVNSVNVVQKQNSVMTPFKSTSNVATPTATLSLLPTPPAAKMVKPIRKVSSKEAEEKRAKGECFWCPEKYTPAHNCKFKQLYILEIGVEEEPENVDDSDVIQLQQMQMDPQISIRALMGVPSYSTMKVIGTIGTKQLQILIDSGSTYNFLDSALALKLQCPTQEVSTMSVTVADGNKLPCAKLCPNFQWLMQGVWFKADVLLLPLKNYDMVMGVQWLQTLNDIVWNFKLLTMQFKIDNQSFELKGSHNAGISLCSVEKMNTLMGMHEHL